MKQIIEVAKLFKRTDPVLPALDSTRFAKTYLEWTHLDVSIRVPFESGVNVVIDNEQFITMAQNFKDPKFSVSATMNLWVSSGKNTLKISGTGDENFPKAISDQKYKKESIGVIRKEYIPLLNISLKFQSDDDLRPVMTYTLFSDYLASTDAHRLYFKKIEEGHRLSHSVLLHRKTIKLLALFGGDWLITLLYDDVKKEGMTGKVYKGIVFKNKEGIEIVQKYEDLKFPDWKVVLPEVDKDTKWVILPKKETLEAIKVGKKFGNRSVNQMIMQIGEKSHYIFQDADFNTEYKTEIELKRKEGVKIEIAFNWNFLAEILSLGGPTTFMQFWGPTKAVILDEQFLLMPIMLNT